MEISKTIELKQNDEKLPPLSQNDINKINSLIDNHVNNTVNNKPLNNELSKKRQDLIDLSVKKYQVKRDLYEFYELHKLNEHKEWFDKNEPYIKKYCELNDEWLKIEDEIKQLDIQMGIKRGLTKGTDYKKLRKDLDKNYLKRKQERESKLKEVIADINKNKPN